MKSFLLFFLIILESSFGEENVGVGFNEANRTSLGVIIYKVGSDKSELVNLMRSICLLEEFFNRGKNYPLLIFYDQLNQKEKLLLSSLSNSKMEFFHTPKLLPEGVEEWQVEEWASVQSEKGKRRHFGVKYRSMLQWRIFNIWSNPLLSKYQYFWYLDTDLFLLEEMCYDPFERMKERNLTFGYLWELYEKDDTYLEGLYNLTVEYLTEFNISTKWFQQTLLPLSKQDALVPRVTQHNEKSYYRRQRYDRGYYYGCFGVGSLSFFTSQKYLSFAEYIARSAGIHKHRWGEQVIYRIALSIFEERERVVQIEDIHAVHLPHFSGRKLQDKELMEIFDSKKCTFKRSDLK